MINLEASREEIALLLKLLNWLEMEKQDLDPTLSMLDEEEIAPAIRNWMDKARNALAD